MPTRFGVPNEYRNTVQQTAASDLIFTLFNDIVTLDEVLWCRICWECEMILTLKVTVTLREICLLVQHSSGVLRNTVDTSGGAVT